MNDLPEWASVTIAVFERIGVGAAVLIFVGAFLWKALPPLTKLLRSWKAQSDSITAAVPRFERDFSTLVGNVKTGFDRMESKLDKALHLPAEGGSSIRHAVHDSGVGGRRDFDVSPSEKETDK
jgi:hypothetical protein